MNEQTFSKRNILRGQYSVKLAELERAKTELERAERRQKWGMVSRIILVGIIMFATILWMEAK